MGTTGLWVLGGLAVVVAAILLEGRRQARVYGRPSGRPNLLGVGLLEVQRMLQPDRHVEVLLEQAKGEEAVPDAAVAGEGEDPEGGAGATSLRP